MFIDFIPVLIAIVVTPLVPLAIGLVLRLAGRRRAARIAAVVSMFCTASIVLLMMRDGLHGRILIAGPLLMAIGLFASSTDHPTRAPTA